MKRLKKIADNKIEKRTYEVEGYSNQLDEFERMLYTLGILGSWGASRIVSMHYDGDGAARLKFRNVNKYNLVKVDDINDKVEKDEIDFYID